MKLTFVLIVWAGLVCSASAQPSARVRSLLAPTHFGGQAQRSYADFEIERNEFLGGPEEQLAACRRDPSKLKRLSFSDHLPERPDVYQFLSLHSAELNSESQAWLRRRSPYLREQLIQAAEKGDERDLRALIRLDPYAAEVASAQLPRGSCLSFVAAAELHPERAEARIQLERIAADREISGRERSQACATLGHLRWVGQEDFMLTLWREAGIERLIDNGVYGFDPLSEWVGSDPQRWGPVMAAWSANADPVLSQHALHCLYDLAEKHPSAEILRPLLVRLKETQTSEWYSLMRGLRECPLPEALDDLLDLADHGKGSADSLIETLAAYPQDSVVPALRKLVPENMGLYALLQRCGAINTDDEVQALEESAQCNISGRKHRYPIGGRGDYLVRLSIPSRALVLAVERRIDELWSTQPQQAAELQGFLAEWQSAAIDSYILQKLQSDQVGAPLLLELPWRRQTLLEMGSRSLTEMLAGGGERAGIAAYLLGSKSSQRQILESQDEPAQNAFLAMARLEGRDLPLDFVISLRQRPNLESAASAYLLASDSPQARRWRERAISWVAVTDS